MLHPPGFWRRDGVIPRLLSPLSVITEALTARRVAQPGWRAPVPVICCGNVTVGGAGKTTVALDIGHRLLAQGRVVHFVLRGYGGTVRGPHHVESDDTAAMVGDEALLLAAVAPTWVGADRAASAHAASAAGAQVLVMDDGLQNPSLQQDLALLVIDGATGFGNGRLLPAGPLREPVAAAVSRCTAAVLIGDDVRGVAAGLPIPVLSARLVPGAEVADLRGRRVVAFAGIALPNKFFAMLKAAGVELADAVPFPDHHPYSEADVARLIASGEGSILVTTPKDAVRLPQAVRSSIRVVGVGLAWEPADAIEAFLRDRLRPGGLGDAQN
jgi:tetraacyldisaccharide 4'-kinase